MQLPKRHCVAKEPNARPRGRMAGQWFAAAVIACASLLLGCSSQPHDTVEAIAAIRDSLSAPNLPDLIVTAVSMSPANVAPGQLATFSATVKNQGTAATPAGVIIGVQFDVDGIEVSWSDTDTQSLAPGSSVTLTANSGPSGNSTWTATSGAHTVLAWVDDVNRIAESDKANNKLSVPLSVGIDLTVTSVSWSPANSASGTAVTFAATVQNVGTVATPAGVIVGVQFDVDGVEVSWSDSYTQSLPPGQSVLLFANSGPTGSSTWTATQGTHTLQAWVDDVNRMNDVNRANNKLQATLSVQPPPPPTDCALGYAGTNCQSCAAGFTLQGGACALAVDGQSAIWPNQFSKANSDPWLVVHHDQVQQVKPNLLALLYANPGTSAGESALVQNVANGFAEGSRTQGFKNSGATPQLQYQISVVDLRDGVGGRPPPPPGFPYQNSTLFPRKTEPDGSLRFDYAGLFRSTYAPNLGHPDPAHPGQFLDLCTLVNQGAVNELWVVGSGDVPDAAALEVGGTMANYTTTGNIIPGSFSRCANGCVDADVPFCGRTLRIGFVNYNRGPGCFLHSKGHDIESGFENSVPSLKEWFRPFASFNLDTRYGLPFSNVYGLCASPPCIAYPSPTHARFLFGSTNYDVDPFDPVCGNVHFPPNGVRDYDYFDTTTQVRSSCTGFGRHSGSGGTDASELIGGSIPLPWNVAPNTQYGDCGGEFLVWWYQNMPGQASGQTFTDGRKMKSIWPYLFY